jgi:hypothetical protein
VVRFNWRIIQAPMRLVHDDHGREFWATLGRLLPDYAARRERLRTEGPRLVW